MNMKNIISALAVGSACLLSACSTTSEFAMAANSGCNPLNPELVVGTPSFLQCKESFPGLIKSYEAKENRKRNGKCDVILGDRCGNPNDQKFGWGPPFE